MAPTDTQKETVSTGVDAAGKGALTGLQVAKTLSELGIGKAAAAGSVKTAAGAGLGKAALGSALALGPAAPIAVASLALLFGARAIKKKKDADKAAAAQQRMQARQAKDAAQAAKEARAAAEKAGRTGGVVAGFDQALGEAALFTGAPTNYDNWKMS